MNHKRKASKELARSLCYSDFPDDIIFEFWVFVKNLAVMPFVNKRHNAMFRRIKPSNSAFASPNSLFFWHQRVCRRHFKRVPYIMRSWNESIKMVIPLNHLTINLFDVLEIRRQDEYRFFILSNGERIHTLVFYFPKSGIRALAKAQGPEPFTEPLSKGPMTVNMVMDIISQIMTIKKKTNSNITAYYDIEYNDGDDDDDDQEEEEEEEDLNPSLEYNTDDEVESYVAAEHL